MPYVFDLEDGEIWQDDEFVQTEFVHTLEQVGEVQDTRMTDAAVTNIENSGHRKCARRDVKKKPDFTRVQTYHKKMYRYQYQNPNWNGVTKKKCRVRMSWWNQCKETSATEHRPTYLKANC